MGHHANKSIAIKGFLDQKEYKCILKCSMWNMMADDSSQLTVRSTNDFFLLIVSEDSIFDLDVSMALNQVETSLDRPMKIVPRRKVLR